MDCELPLASPDSPLSERRETTVVSPASSDKGDVTTSDDEMRIDRTPTTNDVMVVFSDEEGCESPKEWSDVSLEEEKSTASTVDTTHLTKDELVGLLAARDRHIAVLHDRFRRQQLTVINAYEAKIGEMEDTMTYATQTIKMLEAELEEERERAEAKSPPKIASRTCETSVQAGSPGGVRWETTRGTQTPSATTDVSTSAPLMSRRGNLERPPLPAHLSPPLIRGEFSPIARRSGDKPTIELTPEKEAQPAALPFPGRSFSTETMREPAPLPFRGPVGTPAANDAACTFPGRLRRPSRDEEDLETDRLEWRIHQARLAGHYQRVRSNSYPALSSMPATMQKAGGDFDFTKAAKEAFNMLRMDRPVKENLPKDYTM